MNAAALGIVGSLFVSLATSQAAIAQTVAAKQQAQRGEYLIAYGGCNDCHTPKLVTPSGPVPDNSRLLIWASRQRKTATGSCRRWDGSR
jgi:hypothetical protein